MAMQTLHFWWITFFFWIKVFTESTVNFWRNAVFGFKQVKLPSSSLEGKVAVITGANRGIGLETTKTFAMLGATVVMGCRDVKSAQSSSLKEIYSVIEQRYQSNVLLFQLDLASFESINKFVSIVMKNFSTIDYLVNNGGIMMCPEGKTQDGFELQFGTNYLGHFLLTYKLLPLLQKSPSARIINLSSIAHNAGLIHFDNINLVGIYSPLRSYGQSKIAMLLFTKALANRLNNSNIHAYAVHPGLVQTGLYDDPKNSLVRFFKKTLWTVCFISLKQGTQTVLYCCFDEKLGKESGYYYKNCKRDNHMTSRFNDTDADRLWNLSLELCSLTV